MSNLACEEEWRRLAASAAAEQRLMSPSMQALTPNQIRASQGTPLGAPLILSPRMPVPTSAASLLSSQQQLDPTAGLQIYAAAPFTDYTNYAALAAGNPLLQDYTDHTGGLFAR